MKDKTVFDVTKLNSNAFAASLGLAIPPRVRFLQKHLANRKDLTLDEDVKVEKKTVMNLSDSEGGN